MEVAKTIKLNSGYDMPTVGLGTFTVWENPDGQMDRVLRAAIKAGYRHIDTAKLYKTEPLIGSVLAKMISAGQLKREEIFITSKIWCTDHHPDAVRASVAQSLKDLQTDYIDLLLMHFPIALKAGEELFPKNEEGDLIYADVDYVDTWRAMEECIEKGQVRSIGLSNFNKEQTERVMSIAKIKPTNMQIELNAHISNKELADFCLSKGIAVSCYAPLGCPGRSWKEEGEPNLLEDETVKALAAKYNKSCAQVLMRHLLQKGYVVLPKSVTESRLIENINVYDFTMDGEDSAKLDSLNRNLRVYGHPHMKDSPYYPW